MLFRDMMQQAAYEFGFEADEDVYKRQQLEEVRLAMSAEANYALLKKGISIDTEPLVKLVGNTFFQKCIL